MVDRETLKKELIGDFNRLSDLILQYADGDRSVRFERDLLTEEVRIKSSLMSVPDAEWDWQMREVRGRIAELREAHQQRMAGLRSFRVVMQGPAEPESWV